MLHKLKIGSSFLDKIIDGTKKYEIRKDDRDFQTGDELLLNEYDLNEQKYLDRSIKVVVIDVFGRRKEEKQFVRKGHVILSIEWPPE